MRTPRLSTKRVVLDPESLNRKKPLTSRPHWVLSSCRKAPHNFSLSLWLALFLRGLLFGEMCRYQAWEDDSLQSEDLIQSTTDGIAVTGTRLAARLANLEERMTRVEARVERLEARMLYLQKGMRFVCVLFLVTLVYAIWK